MAKSNKTIYLDYSAGVKPNASSIHSLGVKAKKILEDSRKEVAGVLNAKSDEIIFTSGGTESNNLAIQGILWKGSPSTDFAEGLPFRRLPHIITTNIEHPSVLETFKMLEKRKLANISIVPVEKNGIVDPKKIKKEIKDNTIFISIMYANNEIGTIQPIKEIAKEIRHYKKFRKDNSIKNYFPVFHTDAVQAVNYLEMNIEKLGVDLLSISGSKIEGAGRVGILYKKRQIELSPIFGGGDQEFGLRGGTENVADIYKFSKAFVLMQKNKEKENKRLSKLRDYFLKKILKLNDFILINGDTKDRLSNNVNITFPNIPSDLLVLELSARGIMVSSKSACKSSHKDGSYVIQAIRENADKEIGGLRFSLGKDTTKSDIDYTIKSLKEILKKLKKWYN